MPNTEVLFEKDKDTKNTFRFQEQPLEGQEPIMGTIWIKKSVVAKDGNPRRYRIVLMPLED